MAQIVTVLFHLFLVYTLQIQGSFAVTPVFLQTEEDLILNITTEVPTDSEILSWQFKDDLMVTFVVGGKTAAQKSHTGRIDILEKKYSVKLKNLQKSDSGIYTAWVTVPTKQKLTEYNVTVQDLVSQADFTLNSTSNNSLCILTLTCSAENSSISSTLRCDGVTCKGDGGENRGVTKSGASLRIYQLGKSIVCNHSNQISWNESVRNIEDHCTQYGGKRSYIWCIPLIVLILIVVAVFTLRPHHRCKKAGYKYNTENTIYALPELTDQTENLNKTAEDEAGSPTTMYSTVGFPIGKEPTNARGNEQPETFYAQMQKPSR